MYDPSVEGVDARARADECRTATPEAACSVREEIVFVDPAISDLPTFVAGLRSDVQLKFLSGRRSAIAEMAEVLEDAPGVRTIHVVAHGGPGRIDFASGHLSLENLDEQAVELADLRKALAGSDILLWSCETGRGERGAEF